MDDLRVQGDRAEYHWTLTGTNRGPGGSGHKVRIGGFEVWEIGPDGPIAASQGHFDADEYQRQLKYGAAPRFLDEIEVRKRLRMPDLIDAMERALIEFSAGRVQQPVRTVFQFGANSLFGLMPSYVPSLPALGAKLVTVCPGNTQTGLGTHQAVIVMLDPVTGVAEAILDGRYITEVRTAAVSAVSARRLARADAQVLGIVGSGSTGPQPSGRHSGAGKGLPVKPGRGVRMWSVSTNSSRRPGHAQ